MHQVIGLSNADAPGSRENIVDAVFLGNARVMNAAGENLLCLRLKYWRELNCQTKAGDGNDFRRPLLDCTKCQVHLSLLLGSNVLRVTFVARFLPRRNRLVPRIVPE